MMTDLNSCDTHPFPPIKPSRKQRQEKMIPKWDYRPQAKGCTALIIQAAGSDGNWAHSADSGLYSDDRGALRGAPGAALPKLARRDGRVGIAWQNLSFAA